MRITRRTKNCPYIHTATQMSIYIIFILLPLILIPSPTQSIGSAIQYARIFAIV